MVTFREARSSGIQGAMYLVAGGHVRALIDPQITRALPQLWPAVDCIADVLERCLNDESLVVRITIERGPVSQQAG